MPVACGGLPRSLPTDRNLNTESTNPIANNVVAKAIGEINNKSITNEEGVNGIRYYNNKLEYNDGEKWVEMETQSNSVSLTPEPVEDITIGISDRIIILNDNLTIPITWTKPIEYEIYCDSYNVYTCISDTVPTSISDFDIVQTSITDTSTTIEMNNISESDIPNIYILIASRSRTGLVQTNISNMKCIGDLGLPIYNLTGSLGETLEDTSWETVIQLSELGLAPVYYSVGDTKTLSANGTTYTMQIYGFNHDILSDDETSTAGITFGLLTATTAKYVFHENSSNRGKSWMYSSIKNNILDKDIYTTMPEELQSGIKQINKVTNSSTANNGRQLVTDSVKLFMFSEYEIRGTSSLSGCVEGTKYPIFTDNQSMSRGGTYYLRSRHYEYANLKLTIGGTGTENDAYSSGLLFGFCV